MKKTLVALLALPALMAGPALGAVIYTADFSNPGEGSTHDTSGFDPIDSSPIAGTNWTLSFPAPSSDGSTNEFITAGGVMRVQDWGGEGTVTSPELVMAADGTVDITGVASAIGGDVFNNVGTEGITWFYTLNSLTTSVFLGETELGGPVADGTDVGNLFSAVAVSAGDTLEVGFTVNVNGGGDGVEVSTLEVDFTAIPEPTTSLLGALGLVALLRRRR